MTIPKLIYIAEDNPDFREILTTILDRSAYTVCAAVDGREALMLLDIAVPDLLVLDINMPYVSGLDIVRHVRARAKYEHTKVILLSGNTQATMAPETELVDLCLLKPVDVFALKRLVERLIGA